MSKNRLEFKVGLFVFLCLALFAGLMLEFSKGITFRSSYPLILDTSNVGGLRANAMVLMSGVRVGSVSSTTLSPAGTNVAINLKIYGEFVIHDDALFKIESSGFLGDQYVAIYPGASSAFNPQHIKDTASLVKRLHDKTDPVSKFVGDNLDGDAALLVSGSTNSKPGDLDASLILAQFLNRITAGPPLYSVERFQNVKLRPETLDMLDQHPRGQGLVRLNRRLLEDAYPTELGRQGSVLKPNDVAQAEEPFNLQEVARSTAGFIERLDNTAKKLDDTINEIRRDVLNDTTLTNLASAIVNIRVASEKAAAAMDNINLIIQTNGAPLAGSISNLTAFSAQLRELSAHAEGILATNGPQITATISNLQTSSAMLTNLFNDINAGKGLAGEVVKNQALADNVANLASNLAVTTSNLNKMGLWHFIWYKPKTNEFAPVPPPSKSHPPTPQ